MKQIKKSCNNCADYIVCYGFDEVTVDKGENCPDWHLDFMIFQEMHEKKPNSTGKVITKEEFDKILNKCMKNNWRRADPNGQKTNKKNH